MDLSDSDMDTGDSSSLSSSVSSEITNSTSEEGEYESEVEEINDENTNEMDNFTVEGDQLADLLAENRQLKKKIQLLEGNNDPNCLCTIIWQNISNYDTAKIVKVIEKAKIESNQSKSKSKEVSLSGYEHFKRPFTRKYFDQSKESEFDDLFIVDKNTSSLTTEIVAPSYLSLSLDTPEPSKELSLVAARPTKSNPCFNCGLEGHPVRDCPKPKDFRAINKNRLLYLAAAPSDKRYWEDKASKFNPGELSPALREALNISSDASPPWYNKMLKFGYPPGYTREIGYSKDAIVIVDQVSEASEIGKGIGGSCITPTVVFPGIDNQYLIQVSYAIASGIVVQGKPEVISKKKNNIVSDIIEMKDSKKKDKKAIKKVEKKQGKKGDNNNNNNKERNEMGEGKNTNQKKKNQAKDSENKGNKKDEDNGEPKKKEKSLKKPTEETEEIISGPKWSDASEGRYEPTESTGVWKNLHPMLKKRKSEMKLSSSNENL
jgi:hypothetical protein